MKLTKLFSHACDEGGNVTRSYVKVFTNSRKCDFQRYYSYLLKNKMFSELNNLTQAMKMFGLFDSIGNLIGKIAPEYMRRREARKVGELMDNAHQMGQRVEADRNNRSYDPKDLWKSGVSFTSDMIGDDGDIHLDDKLKDVAYMNANDTSQYAPKVRENYTKDPNYGKYGSSKSLAEQMPTEDQLMQDNDILAKQAIGEYGRQVITKGTDRANNDLNQLHAEVFGSPRVIQRTDSNGKISTMKVTPKEMRSRVINSVGANGRKMKMTVKPKQRYSN